MAEINAHPSAQKGGNITPAKLELCSVAKAVPSTYRARVASVVSIYKI